MKVCVGCGYSERGHIQTLDPKWVWCIHATRLISREAAGFEGGAKHD